VDLPLPTPAFDLSGGARCLDFANTLEDRPTPHPIERLASYGDLLAFARATTSLPEPLLAALASAAGQNGDGAAAALARAIEVREAIYRLGVALADGIPAPAADLATLNEALGVALGRAQLVEAADTAGRFGWAWAAEPLSLEAPLWPIVRSAADLLTSPTLSVLRVCAADACNWLFLDGSRNGSRRWCSMRTCGNRAKARRHYDRVRTQASVGADERPGCP
jgi:predicted RNA-binding Zn ribbon-like protein